uniref:Uncharacterized protein n=1 Tax=Nelumbo nucifera TaxID=4432 RepID=A0A822ZP53_NELNU|nr:TPA_asm: hypothetical protein HUJ06_001798 [Nelumbo nucifera]
MSSRTKKLVRKAGAGAIAPGFISLELVGGGANWVIKSPDQNPKAKEDYSIGLNLENCWIKDDDEAYDPEDGDMAEDEVNVEGEQGDHQNQEEEEEEDKLEAEWERQHMESDGPKLHNSPRALVVDGRSSNLEALERAKKGMQMPETPKGKEAINKDVGKER